MKKEKIYTRKRKNFLLKKNTLPVLHTWKTQKRGGGGEKVSKGFPPLLKKKKKLHVML